MAKKKKKIKYIVIGIIVLILLIVLGVLNWWAGRNECGGINNKKCIEATQCICPSDAGIFNVKSCICPSSAGNLKECNSDSQCGSPDMVCVDGRCELIHLAFILDVNQV